MKLLTATTKTTTVAINIVIALNKTRRHFILRACFFSAFSFSSMTRSPSLQLSLRGFTTTNGVPSLKQNASEASA